MAPTDPLLSVRSIDLRFGGTRALQDVSVDVPEESVIALVGPNGAGKSSLLNCISGFYRPTAGSIVFEGRDVSRMRPHNRARRGIARTFQNIELVEDMTVLDNLLVGRDHLMRFGVASSAFGLRHARRGEDDHRQHVEDVIEFLEIEHLRSRIAGSLAHGQKKLVEVGRALASDPKLILFDEPTSGMNREEKEDIARFILRMRYERAITMILVEHDARFVSDLSDAVYVLDAGRVIATGPPSDVFANPEVIRAYLGDDAEDHGHDEAIETRVGA